jgi:hypothetical protein
MCDAKGKCLMQSENPFNVLHASFNWTGLFVLLVSVNVTIWAIWSLTTLYRVVLPISFLSLIVFRHHLNLKTVLIALLLTITVFHPVRFLFDWRLNPISYGIIMLLCLIALLRVSKERKWKDYMTALLLICVLLCGKEMLLSVSELETCWLEDVRYNQQFYCESTARRYQQIESLPIGMDGWCYYCFWY